MFREIYEIWMKYEMKYDMKYADKKTCKIYQKQKYYFLEACI